MKFTPRGRHLEKPIIGYRFAELRLAADRLAELRFRDEDSNECSLQLEDSLTIARGKHETVLVGTRPGKAFWPDSLSLIAEYLGCTVLEALAEEDGN